MTKRKVRHNSRSKPQSLYIGDTFPTTLLNLNQARANDIVVDDVPRQLEALTLYLLPSTASVYHYN